MRTFFMSRFHAVTLALLRIVAGFLFMQHGGQKLFGWMSENPPVELASLMGLAGVLEFLGGILIMLGLLTRPVAFLLAGEMAVAYFMAHFPQHPLPLLNYGEPAALFCFIFLYLSASGPGPFSIDRALGWDEETPVIRHRGADRFGGAGV